MQLPATLTITQASQALLQAVAALEEGVAGVAFTVDASTLTEFDTSAIAVLLDLQRRAQERGVSLVVQMPPAKLLQLATLYGVEDLLGLQTSA